MLKLDKIRRNIQLFFLAVSIALFALLISGILQIAHAYCPQSAVCFGCLNLGQSLGNWMFPAALISGLAILLLTMFIGRRFCGYACPFGTIQELIFSLNKKSGKRDYKSALPQSVHNYLKWLKYLILLATAILAWLGLSYIYMKFCPVVSIAHIQNVRIAGVLSLGVITIAGFFIERFWCNYLCPYAALLNITQWIGKILHLPRNKVWWSKDCCVDCMLCDDYCPMRIKVQKSEKVNDVECIYCHRCELCCPVLTKQKRELQGKKI
ncbi:MAG: 4Fe-4S binding protein [Candidatus Stygibacter australis]|nr:4Fe-4S binding protein [Candidatus Stygibacter australis]MDP8323118.1 4Fe-4S binding protein [Candidatus Stygibacter australis]